MLVPGYLEHDRVKALAKLSGLNPANVKYKRPESPGFGGSTNNPFMHLVSGQAPATMNSNDSPTIPKHQKLRNN